jgi:hypothetical protein
MTEQIFWGGRGRKLAGELSRVLLKLPWRKFIKLRWL